MKKRFFLIFFAVAAVILNAQSDTFPFSPGEFDVDIYQHPYMILIDNPETKDVDTVYTFTNRDNDFELRYAFFAQTETEVENIRRIFALFVVSIINSTAGYEVDLNEVELYDDQDVAEEYNGDIGVSVFIPDPFTEYGGGHAFMLLSFFYKMDQGIVMQTILFDEIEFAGTEAFMELSHTFKFSLSE